MKVYALILLFCMFTSSAFATNLGGARGENFVFQKCYEFGKSGSGSMLDPASGVDGDILAIPADTVVDRVDVVIYTLLTGTTSVLVGDDDDNDGYAAAADVTEGTVGVYNGAGAYLSAGAKKLYAAAGKEIKLDVTGTLTAGKYCVIAQGYRLR